MDRAQRLHLVGMERWDDRQWRWRLRDAGVLAELTPAQAKVLWLAYTLADVANGEFDLPVTWSAAQLALSARAVTRTIGQLVELKLFERVGESPSHARVCRYRLGLPLAGIAGQGAAAGSASRAECPGPTPGAGAVGASGGASRGGDPAVIPDPRVRLTLTPGSKNPDPAVRESKPESERRESSSSATRARSAQRELFGQPDAAGYDAAAAALLRRIFPERVAHGLCCRYRPTAADVRVVLANAAAWRWAARRGNAKPMHSLPGFVRACLRDGLFNADDRLLALRDQGARRAAAATARRRQRAEAHAQAQAQAREQAARERAAAVLEAMTPAQRAELWARVRADVEQRTPLIAERVASWNVETSHPARMYCVGHLMREGFNDGTTERTHAARADGDGPRLNTAGQQSG